MGKPPPSHDDADHMADDDPMMDSRWRFFGGMLGRRGVPGGFWRERRGLCTRRTFFLKKPRGIGVARR